MVHRIVVEDQSLRWYGRPPKIADNSIEFVRFQFHLPEDWDPLVLVAQFTQADTYNMLLDGDTCFLPKELTAGICQVSLFGYSEGKPVRATSIPLVFQIEESGFVSSAETPIPPTPDLYAQLIEYFSGGGATDEQIQKAVSDYLQKNPIEKLTEEELVAAIKAYFEKNPIDAGSDVCVVYVDNNPAMSKYIQTSKTSEEIHDAWLNRVPIYGQYNLDGLSLALRPKTFSENKCVFSYDYPWSLGITGIITIEGDTVTDHLTIDTVYVSVTSQNINGNVVYSANATSDLIFKAHEQNANIYCHLNMYGANVVLNLVACNENVAVFSNSIPEVQDLPGIGVVIVISGENVSYYQWDTVTKEDILTEEEIASIVKDKTEEIIGDTLTEEVLGAYIKEKIDEALKDRPDSGGNVELDTTLTQSGKAADAKAVGDKIAEITGISLIEPAEDDIPKIFFGGALQQTKDEKVVPFRYISKTDDFSGYAEIKAQGNSSMSYPKKNQTVKMFADEACDSKMKKDFKGWGKQNKHVYKANWIDLTHARNVVSARLWADVVKSRANYAELPELLRTSPNQGAVDGFPVKVYADGVYQGRYTLNIPKDKWTFNMDDELDEHCVLCGENYYSGCFRAAAKIDESDWTDEIHDVVPASIKTRWNQVISFVMNSTDEEFKANLSQYFYVDSLIDYYLFGLASCGLDAFGKNQIYATYDGQKWIASMYDMDSTWGLYWNGSKFVASDYARTSYEDYVSTSASGEGNLLYNRLEQLFSAELQTRWAELKNGALSIENIINRFERFTDIAPAELVKEDYASTTGGGKFTGIPSQSTNNIQQIRAFALARKAWTDEYISALSGESGGEEEPDEPEVPETVPCTGITLDKTELTFDGEGTQTITATVTPSDTTDSVVWVSSAPTVASITVEGNVCTVRSAGNGNAIITITCGDYSVTCSVSVSGIETKPLYPFKNGAHAFRSNALLVITNGNHVTLNAKQIQNNINIGNGSENTASETDTSNIANKTTLFALVAGDSVTASMKFGTKNTYTGEVCIFFVRANGNKVIDIVKTQGGTDSTNEVFIDEQMDVGTIGLWVANGGAVVDVEVEIYVNNVLYVGDTGEPVTAGLFVPNWSDAAEYSINNGTVGSGTNYITPDLVELPAMSTVVYISSELFTWVGVAQYDEEGTFIKYTEAIYGGKELLIELDDNAKYARFSGFPNTDDCTDPESQISIRWYSTF